MFKINFFQICLLNFKFSAESQVKLVSIWRSYWQPLYSQWTGVFLCHCVCSDERRVQPAEVFAVLDTAEQDDSSKRIKQHEQEHSHDDEETLEHGHHNRQHQHLQCSLQTYHHALTDCKLLNNYLISTQCIMQFKIKKFQYHLKF